MTDLIDRDALDTAGRELLFLNARTHNGWQDIEVPDSLLMQIYELARWAPTSANCSPLRVINDNGPLLCGPRPNEAIRRPSAATRMVQGELTEV